MCFCMSEGILIVSLYEPISLTSVLVTPADSGLIAGNELVDSVSPRPGLRRSGTRRGRSFLHWPVGSWRNISRCWRRTPPGAAPTSPAGCWGYEAPPGCSPAPNCTLTGDRWEYILRNILTNEPLPLCWRYRSFTEKPAKKSVSDKKLRFHFRWVKFTLADFSSLVFFIV